MSLRWSALRPFEGCEIRVVASAAGVRAIELNPEGDPEGVRDDADPLVAEALRQLRLYFAGDLREFNLPLDFQGTEFQKRVWRALLDIPYGETRSYAQIAAAIGKPKAVRAVGAANGRNPLPIVAPCHRVIGKDGSLTGYGGGLDLKRKLLDLERSPTEPQP